ncbi:lysozyme inhibitor LprI family protein [Reinekea marinisedimentorum]|uniref:Lysozyme inhibitor LprI N-terminal domain-containing protein n=1 Tax=Reinekea marinisedimentorum TaxID=230495 RepID=A0A4R3HUB5_9GAMM|nr:hypothetical protein [Reinekea marinisedimentorum]TCS36692.1 hypothetical protein BCF53_12314 [Reinekea marinisedimentorum]
MNVMFSRMNMVLLCLVVCLIFAMPTKAFADYFSLLRKSTAIDAAEYIEDNLVNRIGIYWIPGAGSHRQADVIRIHKTWIEPSRTGGNYHVKILFEHIYHAPNFSVDEEGNVLANVKFYQVPRSILPLESSDLRDRRIDLAFLYLYENGSFTRLAELIGKGIEEGRNSNFVLSEDVLSHFYQFTYKAFCGASSCDLPQTVSVAPNSDEWGWEEHSVVFNSPLIIPPNLSYPSFNCQKAGTPVEHAICDSDLISKLDRELADRYTIYKVFVPYGEDYFAEEVKADQIEWVASRSECVDDEAVALDCLAEKYINRINELKLHPNPRLL